MAILFATSECDLMCNNELSLTDFYIFHRVLLYDDNHPLSQSPHEVDCEINTILWFMDAVDHLLD